MNLDPRNRHLLVEMISEEEEENETGVLLPEGYSTKKSPYETVKIVDTAPDCTVDCKIGDTIVVETHLINEVSFNDQTFYLVLENYVMGILGGSEEQVEGCLCGINTEKYTQQEKK